MGLKENRDEAVAEAARKCEEADKAEAVAAEAQRVNQDKWDNWRQVQDSIDDDLQKIAEANRKLDDNRDTDTLIQEAEQDKGEALTDEERARYVSVMAGAEHDTLDMAKVKSEIVGLREALDQYRSVVERLVSDEELLRLSRRARQETSFRDGA